MFLEEHHTEDAEWVESGGQGGARMSTPEGDRQEPKGPSGCRRCADASRGGNVRGVMFLEEQWGATAGRRREDRAASGRRRAG